MADECLWAMPDVDSLDYTIKEYMSYIEHMKACSERINENGKLYKLLQITIRVSHRNEQNYVSLLLSLSLQFQVHLTGHLIELNLQFGLFTYFMI